MNKLDPNPRNIKSRCLVCLSAGGKGNNYQAAENQPRIEYLSFLPKRPGWLSDGNSTVSRPGPGGWINGCQPVKRGGAVGRGIFHQ